MGGFERTGDCREGGCLFKNLSQIKLLEKINAISIKYSELKFDE